MHPEVLEVGDRERGLPAVVEQKDGQGGEDDGAVDVVRLGLVGVQGVKHPVEYHNDVEWLEEEVERKDEQSITGENHMKERGGNERPDEVMSSGDDGEDS